MDQLLGLLGDVFIRLEFMTPAIPLAALLVLTAAWLAARRAMRRRTSRALDLLRVWAAMLALSCILLLAGWVVSRVFDPERFGWSYRVIQGLVTAVFAPAAHALRITLLRLIGRPGSGGGRRAGGLRIAAWLLFAVVMLVCAHAMAMAIAFPYGGGEFHGMFAYTNEGRLEVALAAWRWSVLILGIAAIVCGWGWIPLRWWATALLACAAGLIHWWRVVAWHWTPQSPNFHHAVVGLLIAQPFVVMAIAAAGAGVRAWLGTRSLRGRRRHGEPPQVADAAAAGS